MQSQHPQPLRSRPPAAWLPATHLPADHQTAAEAGPGRHQAPILPNRAQQQVVPGAQRARPGKRPPGLPGRRQGGPGYQGRAAAPGARVPCLVYRQRSRLASAASPPLLQATRGGLFGKRSTLQGVWDFQKRSGLLRGVAFSPGEDPLLKAKAAYDTDKVSPGPPSQKLPGGVPRGPAGRIAVCGGGRRRALGGVVVVAMGGRGQRSLRRRLDSVPVSFAASPGPRG